MNKSVTTYLVLSLLFVSCLSGVEQEAIQVIQETFNTEVAYKKGSSTHNGTKKTYLKLYLAELAQKNKEEAGAVATNVLLKFYGLLEEEDLNKYDQYLVGVPYHTDAGLDTLNHTFTIENIRKVYPLYQVVREDLNAMALRNYQKMVSRFAARHQDKKAMEVFIRNMEIKDEAFGRIKEYDINDIEFRTSTENNKSLVAFLGDITRARDETKKPFIILAFADKDQVYYEGANFK